MRGLSMRPRFSAFIVPVVVLILCGAALCGAALAQEAAPPPAVSVIPVTKRQVTETGDFIGRVIAIDKVDIVARVPGFIEQRALHRRPDGQDRRSSVSDRAGHLQGRGRAAEANLAKAKATEVNAALQLDARQGAGAQPEHPAGDGRSARRRRGQRRRPISSRRKPRSSRRKINLRYTEIHAPIDGRIGLANFTVGNLVGPSSGTLATIVSQDPIYVIFQASERDVLEYQAPHRRAHRQDRRTSPCASGCPTARIYAAAGADRFPRHPGDPQTDTVAVRAQLPNPQGLLVAGGIVGVIVEARHAANPRWSFRSPPCSSTRPAAMCWSSMRDEEGRAAAHHDRPRSGHRHRRDERAQGGRAA